MSTASQDVQMGQDEIDDNEELLLGDQKKLVVVGVKRPCQNDRDSSRCQSRGLH